MARHLFDTNNDLLLIGLKTSSMYMGATNNYLIRESRTLNWWLVTNLAFFSNCTRDQPNDAL